MPHDVFISHSSHDKAAADEVCAYLEAANIRCWMAPRDVLPGIPYGEAIMKGIQGSRLMLLIYSRHSNLSPQVMREVERAVNHNLYLLPLRIENVPPSASMEYFISANQWMDALSRPLSRHLGALTRTVRIILDGDATVLGRPIPAPIPSRPAAVRPAVAVRKTAASPPVPQKTPFVAPSLRKLTTLLPNALRAVARRQTLRTRPGKSAVSGRGKSGKRTGVGVAGALGVALLALIGVGLRNGIQSTQEAAVTKHSDFAAQEPQAPNSEAKATPAEQDKSPIVSDFQKNNEKKAAVALEFFTKGEVARSHGDTTAALDAYSKAVSAAPGSYAATQAQQRIQSILNEPEPEPTKLPQRKPSHDNHPKPKPPASQTIGGHG